jgi:hypothetical protein
MKVPGDLLQRGSHHIKVSKISEMRPNMLAFPKHAPTFREGVGPVKGGKRTNNYTHRTNAKSKSVVTTGRLMQISVQDGDCENEEIVAVKAARSSRRTSDKKYL